MKFIKKKGKKFFLLPEMFIVQIWDVTSNIFNINIFWLILQFTSSNSIKGKETNKLGVCVWKILNRWERQNIKFKAYKKTITIFKNIIIQQDLTSIFLKKNKEEMQKQQI
jgi:hypothetical protein